MDNIKRSLYAIRAGSAFEKSLLKATYDGDFDPPKEKHVQTVLWSLQGKSDKHTPDQALNLTVQRLNTGKWVTILKGLMILHRGIEVVGSNYPQKIACLNLLLGSFNDPSEKGSAHNKIIQDYYSYIKIKAVNHSRKEAVINIEDSEKARFIGRLRSTELIKELGALMNQLEGLVKLGPNCHQALKNYHLRLTQNCVFLILKDSASLYKATSLCVDKVIDVFNTLERSHAEVAAELYQKFETCSRMMEQFFKMSEILPYSGLTAPVIVTRSRETLVSMKDYINGSEYKKGHGEAAEQELGLELSPQELEAQRKLLEQFEKEHKKKIEEERNSALISDPVVSEQAKPEPAGQGMMPGFFPQQEISKVDLIMEAFNQPPGGNPGMANPNVMATGMMPGMMNPMMNPMMTGMMNPFMTGMPMMGNQMMGYPMMGNPMMGNPMMGNPMMGNPMMGNPMMGNPMMANPMMGNPMMAGMNTTPGKVNLDPLSQPTGSLVPDNKKNPFAAKPSQQTNNYFVPGGNNIDNLFSAKPNPPAAKSNPFESSEKPPGNSKKDPFSDLI